MNIVHVIDSISHNDGGPPNVVMHLAAAQAATGARVVVLTFGNRGNREWLSQWRRIIVGLENVELQEVTPGWRFSRRLLRTMRGLRNSSDIMHVHGVWRPLAGFALFRRRGGNAATVLAPHGMLSPWALANKPIRKKLAMRAGWNRLIASADLFHAVSGGEHKELRALIATARVAVIPNGVSAAEVSNGRIGTGHNNVSRTDPYILYLARLHRMKGPDLLLRAFADVAQSAGSSFPYKLIMAGPDYGEKPALHALARQLGIEEKVDFPGPVYGEAKRQLYRAATIFCQPSRYEGFSVALLEALAAGLPVLTTPEANFPEIQSHHAGIVCKGEEQELARNLHLLLSRPELRLQMGQRGIALIRNGYTWDRIAKAAIAAYEGALKGSI